jgi:hypothetical protein
VTSASSAARQSEAVLSERSRPERLKDILHVPAYLGNDLDTHALQHRLQPLRNGPANHRRHAQVQQLCCATDQIGAGQRRLELAPTGLMVIRKIDDQEMPSLVAHRGYAGLPVGNCDLHATLAMQFLRQNKSRRDYFLNWPKSGRSLAIRVAFGTRPNQQSARAKDTLDSGILPYIFPQSRPRFLTFGLGTSITSELLKAENLCFFSPAAINAPLERLF